MNYEKVKIKFFPFLLYQRPTSVWFSFPTVQSFYFLIKISKMFKGKLDEREDPLRNYTVQYLQKHSLNQTRGAFF